MADVELIDDELIIFTLLKRDLPDSVTIAAELDVDSIDHLPFVTFSVRGGDQVGNGPGLWNVPVTFRVFAEGQDSTWELCRDLFTIVHEWATPGASTLTGLGHVSAVDDVSKFSRDATVDIQGKNVTQYSGSFDLLIRNK